MLLTDSTKQFINLGDNTLPQRGYLSGDYSLNGITPNTQYTWHNRNLLNHHERIFLRMRIKIC